MTMLLNKMTSLRKSVSSLRWLALIIYCLSLTIPQDGGRYNYVYCAWIDYRYIFSLLLVQNAGMKYLQMEK